MGVNPMPKQHSTSHKLKKKYHQIDHEVKGVEKFYFKKHIIIYKYRSGIR